MTQNASLSVVLEWTSAWLTGTSSSVLGPLVKVVAETAQLPTASVHVPATCMVGMPLSGWFPDVIWGLGLY